MRKIKIILLIVLIHFTVSIIIIPVANNIDQKWFDTGIRDSFADGVVHLSGLVLLPLRIMDILASSCECE